MFDPAWFLRTWSPLRRADSMMLRFSPATPIGKCAQIEKEKHQHRPHARATCFFRPCSQKDRVAKNSAYNGKYKCGQPEFLHLNNYYNPRPRLSRVDPLFFPHIEQSDQRDAWFRKWVRYWSSWRWPYKYWTKGFWSTESVEWPSGNASMPLTSSAHWRLKLALSEIRTIRAVCLVDKLHCMRGKLQQRVGHLLSKGEILFPRIWFFFELN